MQLDLFNCKTAQSSVWSVKIGGKTISYTLRKSARARHVWLRFGIGTGLEVVAPARMPLAELDRILLNKSSWIGRHTALPGAEAPVRLQPLGNGSKLRYLGVEHKLRVHVNGSAGNVRIAGGEILAEVPPGGPEVVKEVLEDWYKKMARKVIGEKVNKLSNGRKVGRVCIRDQKTRWGSCSAKGNLSFNWRLIMAPPRVIDYLVIHELTHLDQPDHSKKFWNKVAARCPDYEEREAWLKTHGLGLWPA